MRPRYYVLTATISLTVVAVALGDTRSTSARSGDVIFESHCASCHTGGISGFFSGAPDAEDSDDMEALAPKGLDRLTENTIAGIGDMVARGGCAQCTDEEIRNAVEHMLRNVE